MKVMLDTNICTYLIKQQPPTILERFLAHPVGDIGISSITAAELAYGVSKSRHTTKNRHALEQFLPPPSEVIAFDQVAAWAYGRSREQLGKRDAHWLDGSAHRRACPNPRRPARQ